MNSEGEDRTGAVALMAELRGRDCHITWHRSDGYKRLLQGSPEQLLATEPHEIFTSVLESYSQRAGSGKLI